MKPLKRKKAGLLTKLVILALILYAAASLVTLGAQKEKSRQENERLQKQLSDLLLENEGLKYDLEHSADPDVIESIARNKLGLIKPGEKIFYDAGG